MPTFVLRSLMALGLVFALPWSGARAAPDRVVSIGGAVTEIVYALEQQGRLVGVDSTSLYPDATLALAQVGYMRQLSAEPILSLAPDTVLAVEDSGPPVALELLRAAGVNVVGVTKRPDFAGVLEKVRIVAYALEVPARGAALAARLEADYQAALADVAARAAPSPRAIFVLSPGNGQPLVAGAGTTAEGIVELAGGTYAINGFREYRVLTAEAAITAAPDVILATHGTIEAAGGIDGVLAMPGLALTPAGQARRVVAIDGLKLLGFGPRTPEAIRELAAALRP